MDEAISRYTKALQAMLDVAFQKLEEIKEICSSPSGLKSKILALLDKNFLKELNALNVQPFKDSLKIEFISLIESYIKRLQKNSKARFPRVTVSKEQLCEEIFDAISLKALNKLIYKLETYNNIYFCRYSDCRDYSLLFDPIKKRFYVKLYLLSSNDELKHKPCKNSENPLIVVGKNKLLSQSNKPERFILSGLSFGKEQEKLLTKALEKPEMLKSARLLKRKDEYFLVINMAVASDSELITKSYAGFITMPDNVMRYTVCKTDGELITKGEISNGSIDISLPNFKEKLHVLANKIVELCSENQSQAVFESYPHYNDLVKILDYKLPLKGLQKPVRVSPFGLWQTCPRCGYNCKKNSAMGFVFICAACGFGIESKLLPSYNLSKRLIKYQGEKIRFYCENIGHKRIIKNRLLCIEYTIGKREDIDDFFEYIKAQTEIIRSKLENRQKDWAKEEKKLYSLWNKLLNTDDIRKVIEIEG